MEFVIHGQVTGLTRNKKPADLLSADYYSQEFTICLVDKNEEREY